MKECATPAEETPHPTDPHAPAVTGRAETPHALMALHDNHDAEPIAARAS